MIKPHFPTPANRPAPVAPTTGEGAQTALAAMIHKRKMGENHVDPEAQDLPPPQPPAA